MILIGMKQDVLHMRARVYDLKYIHEIEYAYDTR
jgi:hypothetical protein